MRILVAIGAIAVAAMLVPAVAQVPESEKPGRFTLQPVEGGGVLRMDNETGALVHCTKREADVACEGVRVVEEQSRQQLVQLGKENADLKAEIKRLEDLLANPAQSGGRHAHRSPKFEFPSEEDVDKALSYMERMFKKFRDKMKDLEGGRSTPL